MPAIGISTSGKPLFVLMPAPMPEALPELCETLCPECSGVGFHEAVTGLGLDVSERCTTCFGRGSLDVCGGCGATPSSDTDTCLCNACEACSKGVQVRDALCSACLIEGYRKVIEEEDPTLADYYSLRAEDLPESVIKHEMQIALREGWL